MKECKHCGKHFIGMKIAKYCEEHRHRKFGPVKVETTPDRYNTVFQSSNPKTYHDTFSCACCGKGFEVVVIHSVKVYPKYCEEHRTLHRRKMYELSQGVKSGQEV